MDFVKVIILSIVEGITEFLPVSSTGHLILVEEFIRLSEGPEFTAPFMVIIQFPAILAVVVYFWPRLWPFGKPRDVRNAQILLWTKIVVAFLPAAVFGLLLHKFIQEHLFNPLVVATALFLGGVILVWLERRKRTPVVDWVNDIGYGRALAVGFFQCLAMIPGTSRSASTIIGGMALGASRAAAVEFSFFLAIPTMLGATTLEMIKTGASFTPIQWALLALGSVVSFAVAYVSVAFLMNYIRRHDFRAFGYYRIALALTVLAYFWFVGFGE